jgi:hypothetical protein
MRRSNKIAIVAALAFLSSQSICADEAFDANYATANGNAATEQGAAFDAALSAAIEQAPGVAPQITQCLKDNPGPHAVHGYFLFTSAATYRVFLEPESAFSACLSRALENRIVPVPPELPYFNPFAFSVQP